MRSSGSTAVPWSPAGSRQRQTGGWTTGPPNSTPAPPTPGAPPTAPRRTGVSWTRTTRWPPTPTRSGSTTPRRPRSVRSTRSAAGKFYVDYATNQLYLGSNPTGQTVRASDLSKAISVRARRQALRGLRRRRFAPSVPDMGAVTIEKQTGEASPAMVFVGQLHDRPVAAVHRTSPSPTSPPPATACSACTPTTRTIQTATVAAPCQQHRALQQLPGVRRLQDHPDPRDSP